MSVEIYVQGVTFIIDTDDEFDALAQVNDSLGEIAFDWTPPIVEA